MTRSAEKAEQLRAMGATPASATSSTRRGCARRSRPPHPRWSCTSSPTSPQRSIRARLASVRGNNRIRARGHAQPRRRGARRRAPADGRAEHRLRLRAERRAVKTEDDPLFDDAPGPWRRRVARCTRSRTRSPAPRASRASCCGTASSTGRGPPTPRTATTRARSGAAASRWSAEGTGVFSFIHVDDAASATVAAVERGRPGIYNIVDDDPAPVSEWLPVYAEALGAKKPCRVPKFIGRSAGRRLRDDARDRIAGRVERAREAGARLATRYASWRAGLSRVARLGLTGRAGPGSRRAPRRRRRPERDRAPDRARRLLDGPGQQRSLRSSDSATRAD